MRLPLTTGRCVRACAVSRRQLALCAVTTVPNLLALPAPAAIGTNDAKTVLNSVLSAYGIPVLRQGSEWRDLDEFDLEYTLSYPRAWVARPNTQREGIYIADFKTADKITVEVLPAPANDDDLVDLVVQAAVSPGNLRDAAKMGLPSPAAVRVERATVDGHTYTYLYFPSDTITNSGYNIRRRNLAAATVKGGRVYAVIASARSDFYDDAKAALLQRAVQSFRVR